MWGQKEKWRICTLTESDQRLSGKSVPKNLKCCIAHFVKKKKNGLSNTGESPKKRKSYSEFTLGMPFHFCPAFLPNRIEMKPNCQVHTPAWSFVGTGR